MKAFLLMFVAACGSRDAEKPPAPPSVATPTETETETLGVVFERLLVDRDSAPLFGPDDSVTVGAHRWNADGSYAGRHSFERSGQLHPVAIAGEPDAPRVIALGWDGLDDVPPAPPAEDRAWLVTADLRSEVASTTTPIHHEFLGENNFELSPDRSSLVTIERSDVVVRAAVTGVERARHALGAIDDDISFPDAAHVCWLDDEHVAWIGIDRDKNHVLRVAAVHGAIATTPLASAARIVACDPAGGVAAVTIAGSLAVLDLDVASVTTAIALDDAEHHVAIAAHGLRLAVASDDGVSLYRREDTGYAAAYTVATPAPPATDDEDSQRVPLLAVSRDGHRLAIAGATLVVIGDVSTSSPAPVVPAFPFDLPPGFVAGAPVDVAWQYAQLPVPSGRAALPALLLQARSDDDPYAHVIALAVSHAELSPLPADTASDEEMTAFAKRTMQRWFEGWQVANEGYTISVGRTNGMRWFEARELQRHGCEPYDGYTRVVIDKQLAYIVRAITVPGGTIDGWLAPFLDIPFGAHVKTALRRGPRSGPC